MLGDGEYGVLTKQDDESIFRGVKILLDDSAMVQHYINKSIERSVMFEVSSTMNEVYSVVTIN